MAITKSGLAIRTVEVEREGARRTFAHEHPWLTRFTHWLNAITLLVLTASGMEIFEAFPSFGAKIPQADFIRFPDAVRLGGWLGGALQWHLTFAWLFTITGVVYALYQIVSGHWRRVILRPKDLRGLWPMARHYFLFKPKPEQMELYNPLQKLAYTSTILFGVVSVVTGVLLFKPAQFAPLVNLLGGFGMIRIYHFAAMIGFLSFIPGHLVMVALHGWNNFYSMLTGWKRDPDYLICLTGGSFRATVTELRMTTTLTTLRYDWSADEIGAIYTLPMPELIFRAQGVHRAYHRADEVQGCALLSVKTGGCPEDCAYCPQSAHYQTGTPRAALVAVAETVKAAERARGQGATRFCMGAAWRDAPQGPDFERVLEMVRGVRALGMETCCTLGMLTEEQSHALAAAGLHAYNHNLDTSPEFYGEIITTRTYQERLQTLARVRQAGITICCGGIIGLGENREHRYRLLEQLAAQRPHPESVPINTLVRVEGTPLANEQPIDPFELVRMIATARILMPGSMVRLSAGRLSLSDEAQALCFLAGANSIFIGDRLLTTDNPKTDHDRQLFDRLGMRLLSRPASGNQNQVGETTVRETGAATAPPDVR